MKISERLQEAVGKPHLSYSSIKYALGDMRLWEMYMKGQLKKESEALHFGSIYDLLLFEPEKFGDQYYTFDDTEMVAEIGGKSPRTTKKYRDWKAEVLQQAQDADKKLASTEDVTTAKEMIHRLEVCGLKERRLTGQYQVEFNEEIDGVLVKGFLDCLGDGWISDSKSTRFVNKFRYSVRDFCYDVQAYIYCKVFGVTDFYWVVQEKAFPYFPAEVKCTEETLFSGEMKYHQALENINAWLDGKRTSDSHYAEFSV